MNTDDDVYKELDPGLFAEIKPRLKELWHLVYKSNLTENFLYADRIYIVPHSFLIEKNFKDVYEFGVNLGVVDSTWVRFLFTDDNSKHNHLSTHLDTCRFAAI